MRRACKGLGVLALLVCVQTLAEGWSYDGALGAGYDSNIGNAGSSPDERKVAVVDASLGTGYAVPFSLFTAMQLRGSLDGEAVTDLDRLSNLRAALRVGLLHKPGEGFYVPVLAAWTSGGYRESASAPRSGAEWRAGAYLIEPVTTQVRTRLGFGWLGRYATSRVFDGAIRSYELNVDWQPAPPLTIYGGYRLDDGPIVVSAYGDGQITPKTEHLRLQGAADHIEPDRAFGDNWFAFRVYGRTGIATLGANVPLSSACSIDAQLREAHSSIDYSQATYSGSGYPVPYRQLGYDRWLAGLSLLFRF